MHTIPELQGKVTRRRILAGTAGAGLSLGLATSISGIGRSVTAQEATPSAESTVGAPTFADLSYSDSGDPMHKLDLYLPDATGGPIPLVIWIHGGAWIGGDKRRVGVTYLLEDGYAIASINYRLMPEALPPAQIQDANAAAAFLWESAEEYGFDRERFVLAGASAGGRSTGLVGLSLNDAVPEFEISPDVRFAALLDFFGGVDNPREDNKRRRRRRQADLTAAERLEILSLIDTLSYIDGDDPPTLIVHGEEDRVVPIEQSEELAAALEAAGVPVQFERVPGKGHGIVKFQDEQTKAIVRDFLATYVG